MACNHDCTNCGACSRGASPISSNSYSSASSGHSSKSEIFANEIYACAGHDSGSCSSYSSSHGSYSGGSGSFGSSSYSSGSLDAIVSSYHGAGASASGDYSGVMAASMSYSDKESYAINLDAMVTPIIYESRSDSGISSGSGIYENRANSNSLSDNRQYQITAMPGMIFTPAPFLKKNRPYTMFVGQAYEIQDFIKEAFRATTGNELPKNVVVEVCSKERLREIHESFGGQWSNNIQGFAINKKHIGDDSLVFIASGHLDKVMLTIGHEIGHVMSSPLADKRAEEAKAFAFSIAWMKAIKENNIAGLADAIELDEPAHNGLHNVALEFVLDLMKTGKNAMDVFGRLASSKLSFNIA